MALIPFPTKYGLYASENVHSCEGPLSCTEYKIEVGALQWNDLPADMRSLGTKELFLNESHRLMMSNIEHIQ